MSLLYFETLVFFQVKRNFSKMVRGRHTEGTKMARKCRNSAKSFIGGGLKIKMAFLSKFGSTAHATD